MARRSIRSLMEDFNGVDHPPNTDTIMGALQGTPGEGTSSVESPTMRFLHRLLKEAPDLEKEMMRLQQKVRKEQGIIEEEIRKDR